MTGDVFYRRREALLLTVMVTVVVVGMGDSAMEDSAMAIQVVVMELVATALAMVEPLLLRNKLLIRLKRRFMLNVNIIVVRQLQFKYR